MQRIVNGHFADPNSTRDITGITPEEFKCLIEILCEKYKSIEQVYGMDENERDKILFQIELQINPDADMQKVKKQAKETFEKWTDQYRIIYNFLTAINQPYPGAEYPNHN